MIIKNYNETRRISMSDLRNLCIKENWYTEGTNKEYGKLLATAEHAENLTTELVIELAEDIMQHSEVDKDIDNLQNICYLILRAAHTFISIE